MTIENLLVDCIELCYRESNLKNNDFKQTLNICKKVLQLNENTNSKNNELYYLNLKASDYLVNILSKIMDLIKEPIEKEFLINLINKEFLGNEGSNYKEILITNIEKDLSEDLIIRYVLNLKTNITNNLKENEFKDIIKTAYYKIIRKKDVNTSIYEIVNDLKVTLEKKLTEINTGDNRSLKEVDFSDSKSVENVLKDLKDVVNEKSMMKTGFKGLNEMLQGGIRRGEFVTIAALQHNYKTGMSLSLFAQLCMHNKPYLYDKDKKPLMLRISFEDDLTNNLTFLYLYLKYYKERIDEKVKLNDITLEDMKKYVTDELLKTGFNVKLLRVNPSEWTYMDIQKMVIDLESQGYEIHCLMLDYLGKIPTTGCLREGPLGTDLRDLFRRIRNFCSIRKITLITPHQISPDAKQLLRNGIEEENFVKDIVNKGYYSGSKQLDQEIDIEIMMHKVEKRDYSYLTLQRGKHRISTVIDDKFKYIVYKFPKFNPIPPDIEEENSTHRYSIKQFKDDISTDNIEEEFNL